MRVFTVFDVWHRRIREPPFSSVHAQLEASVFKNLHLGEHFENARFRCPFSSDTRRQQVKPEEKYPFSIKNADTRGGGLNSFHIWEEK